MKQEEKEKIARNAASGWCRCFKCDGIINTTHDKCEKDRMFTCRKWYDGYRTSLLALGDDRIMQSLWKDAQGDDLPEYWVEVIAMQGRKIVFAHRPDPKGWNARNLSTDEVEHYTPMTYDKGGWNIEGVTYWLDAPLPEGIE